MKNPLAMLFVGLSMVAFGIMGLVLIAVIWFGATWYANVSEINECGEWKTQSVTLKGFYLTQWQADQCAAHNIKIIAPIK